MKYYSIKVSDEVNLYPLVCHHFGAKQSNEKFIDHVIAMIKNDPKAKWIYMGDAGECVTKLSKGNMYEQTLNPGDQMRMAIEKYSTVAAKGLFGVRGNHGNRIDKEVGLGWDEMLCNRVGIPYLGVTGLVSLGLSGRRKPVSLFVAHGGSGSTSSGGKMTAGHKAVGLMDVDINLSAHTHACGEAWPFDYRAYLDPSTKGIRWKKTVSYICGSAYDSRSGYAEEMQYAPLLPEHIIIKVRHEDGVLITSHKKIILDGVSGKIITA